SYSVARLIGLWIFGVLALIPFALKAVNGVAGNEHVPPIQGVFYFLCLCAVLLIDNCVTRRSGAATPALPGLSVPTALLILSIIASLVPLVCHWLNRKWVVELMTIKALNENITQGAIV